MWNHPEALDLYRHDYTAATLLTNHVKEQMFLIEWLVSLSDGRCLEWVSSFPYRCKLRRRGSNSTSWSPSWDGVRPKTTVRSTRAKTVPSRTSSQVGDVGQQSPSFPVPGSLWWCWARHNNSAPYVTRHIVPFSQANSSHTDTLGFWINPSSGNKLRHESSSG